MNKHQAVMLEESVEALNIVPQGKYLDCTLGGGGHSLAIAERLGKDGQLFCIDRDKVACDSFSHHKALVFHTSFSLMGRYIPYGLDGVLMDLGTSYNQLADGSRGFSFLHDGPLDMRMDPLNTRLTALEIIQTYSINDLSYIFKHLSDEKYHLRIARAIKRDVQRILTTLDLASLIIKEIGWQEKNRHPATRVFQALRMVVNEDLKELTIGFEEAFKKLRNKGRMVVICFQPLEERLLKSFIQSQTKGKDSSHFKFLANAQIIVSRMTPSSLEVKRNIRSRNASLRCIEKVLN